MAKPPKSPPHSDVDGVHEDELDNTDAAIAAGQDSADLERARDESKGRPEYSGEDEEDGDDRSA